MSTPYEVPLTPEAQTFQLTLAGVLYTLRVSWCDPAQAWTLDIADLNGVPIVNGIPIVTGTDLLGQYAYLGIEGQLIVQTDSDVDAVPTYTNLGIAGRLYFVTTP